ncbi:PREDICTED: putative phosphatidylglycerol/phosphatidylinositol transfer protein DDB_G0282179 [Camelina sativa]|uniref:Phosphatidylglycerol/phosphatidylinositol transfer protein DDB_G0282179 n=1 Tax=Camelina sativa TaxID=90675 RepID=A0ABM0XJE2_CAMSA|nr:PREDICTED: putative phosphatidylglycerol/phosphatidylinositol transfer protein DDB_G0282179 [Camelina sativa]
MSKYMGLCSLAISYFLFVSTIVAATDVHYCDSNEEYEVKVKGVNISPYPIARGEPATFSISANTDTKISSGKLVIEVSYFGWHIHSETHDLCDETSCPVAIGDFLVAHSQVLPGYTPPGSYSLKMKMLDARKKELTCIKFAFDIGFGSSSVADM